MSLLINELPTTLMGYDIYPDYRTWIKFEQLLTDKSVPNDIMLTLTSRLIFKCNQTINPDLSRQILWFFRGGKNEEASKSSASKLSEKVYDWDYDDDYIYAAFFQQYNIDLQSVNLHWWIFKALFNALSEENLFVKIMGYRAIKIDNSMSSEQRHYYQRMKKLYKLPVDATELAKATEIENLLLQGKF